MKENKVTLDDKIKELEKQVAWFEGEDFTVEEAVDRYKSTKKLAEDIAKDIEELKNVITVIKKED